MSESVNGFIGTWQVKWLTGKDPVFPVGTVFQIGTGADGAVQPFLDEVNNVAVGFVIQEPDADAPGSLKPVLSSEGTTQPLRFRDGVLFFDGHIPEDPNPDRLRVYISLAMTLDDTSRFLYGTTLRGDPDQVAVWGAMDHTPP